MWSALLFPAAPHPTRDYQGSAKPAGVSAKGLPGTGKGKRSQTLANPYPYPRVFFLSFLFSWFLRVQYTLATNYENPRCMLAVRAVTVDTVLLCGWSCVDGVPSIGTVAAAVIATTSPAMAGHQRCGRSCIDGVPSIDTVAAVVVATTDPAMAGHQRRVINATINGKFLPLATPWATHYTNHDNMHFTNAAQTRMSRPLGAIPPIPNASPTVPAPNATPAASHTSSSNDKAATTTRQRFSDGGGGGSCSGNNDGDDTTNDSGNTTGDNGDDTSDDGGDATTAGRRGQ
ncbi:hypothetical protein EDB85DRAFT_1896947 [Lactarius pseudohatsudake]|nr:hypothetical protein EDB85DRAFT_1896947 [Lactarius pseudohatsudake]